MKNNLVEFPSEYEEMLNKLENQITELFSEIHYYQALLTEKENTIIRLTTENRYLKAQMQTVSSKLTPIPAPPQQSQQPISSSQESNQLPIPPQELNSPSHPNQGTFTPPPRPPSPPQHLSPPPTSQELFTPRTPPPMQYSNQNTTNSEIERVNKRVCPQCGAMGFAIKEVDDRTRIISYNPQRIYAKKKSCTKCRYEWH